MTRVKKRTEMPEAPRGEGALMTIPDDNEVIEAIIHASRAMVGIAVRSLTETGEAVTLPQYRTLVELTFGGPRRLADLAEALSVSPSTATRMCDRLVRKRLINRRRDVVDRRVVLLDLSASGRRLVDRVTERRRQEIGRILEAVDPAEHGALVRAFTSFGQAAGEVPEDGWKRSWEL